MAALKSSVLSIIAVLYIGAGAALAQAQASPPPPTSPPAASQPSTTSTAMEDVSKWTRKQWHAAKARWVQEKEQWADCRNQANAKSLSGRPSWQFLYDCMMNS
jgi:hypothetical protein